MKNQLVHIIYERLKKAITNKSIRIKEKDYWSLTSYAILYDIVIYRGVYPLAVIEVKEKISDDKFFSSQYNKLQQSISRTNSRYGILTNNEEFWFIDKAADKEFWINSKEKFNENIVSHGFSKISFNDLIQIFNNPPEFELTEKLRTDLANIIIKSTKTYLPDNKELNSLVEGKNLKKTIKFNNSSNTFYFTADGSESYAFENHFFICLLGKLKDKRICRYTTLDTLHSMLKNISFRMNGLAGMNDKTEINYVDTYLNGFEKPLSKEHHSTIMALNKRYITSCTSIKMKDDLTLWRLYSDDGKGVCLVFSVESENLNSKILLHKVKYADDKGIHKELELLKQIMNEVEQLTGFKFEFRKLGYWKHFFKPFEYRIEQEIRLLVIDDKSIRTINQDWIITKSHKILNPIIDFVLNDITFPIRLREIVLGPKCPEMDINKAQLEELIRRKKRLIKEKKLKTKLDGLSVKTSSIKHYR